jgi:hypothetical protein
VGCLVVLPLAASLVACGGIAPSTQVSAAQSKPAARTAPSGFVVRPNVVRAVCNGGRGARMSSRGAGEAVVASGIMGNGSTLTAFSQIYPGKNFAVLDSVTARCARDRKFGDAGVAKVRISPGLVPLRTAGQRGSDYLWINAVTARHGGGAIVAGTYRDRWVVGAVSPAGRLDSKFGTDGWTALPLQGEVSAVVQEPSGRIVVGGDNDGGGCCTVNHAAALSSHGHWDRGFGRRGRAKLPTGEDSGVIALALEPNGDILAEVGYGNMGCWGLAFAMLTPSGRPVHHFAGHLRRFWRRLGFGAFVGDAYVDGGGFTLVGTGQKPCSDGLDSAKSATGVLARFRANGAAATPAVRFPSKLYGEVAGFKDGADTLVAESPYAGTTHQTLLLLRPDGSTNRGFGSNGRVRIRTPWHSADAAIDATVPFTRARSKSLVVVATRDGRKQLAIIRLQF